MVVKMVPTIVGIAGPEDVVAEGFGSLHEKLSVEGREMWEGGREDKEAVGPSCMLFQSKALAFIVRGMMGRGRQ